MFYYQHEGQKRSAKILIQMQLIEMNRRKEANKSHTRARSHTHTRTGTHTHANSVSSMCIYLLYFICYVMLLIRFIQHSIVICPPRASIPPKQWCISPYFAMILPLKNFIHSNFNDFFQSFILNSKVFPVFPEM